MGPLRRLYFRVEAESPLLLGRAESQNNYLETQKVLPGAALRGALAEILLAECRAREYIKNHEVCPSEFREGCLFYKIFCVEPVPFFGPAYPSAGRQSFPLPLTACTCKAHPGFRGHDGHGIFDTLIRRMAFEEALDKNLKLAFFYWPPRCPTCGGRTEQAKGFYEQDAEGAFLSAQPKTRRLSHTAINRARGVAEDELLYTLETISPWLEVRGTFGSATHLDKARFFGHAIVEEGRRALLAEGLRRIKWLGRGITRGLGRVRVEPLSEKVSQEESLEERIERFNELFRAERELYYKIGGESSRRFLNLREAPQDEWYFTVDLLSPAILTAEGLPTLRPELGLEGAELCRAFARPEVASGWFAAARLPRSTRLATAQGSVFVYRAKAGADRSKILARLAALEMEGLGSERQRGYGQVIICSPFHTEVEPK